MALPPTRLHLESKDRSVPGGQQGFSPPREMQAEASDFMQGVLQRFSCLECAVYSWHGSCGADGDKCEHPFFSYNEEIRAGSMSGRSSLCLALSMERRGWTWGWAPL